MERGFRIEDLVWLKKGDKVLGKFALLGIWFDSEAAAEWIIYNGLMVGEKFIGNAETAGSKKQVFLLSTIQPPGAVMQGNTDMRTL